MARGRKKQQQVKRTQAAAASAAAVAAATVANGNGNSWAPDAAPAPMVLRNPNDVGANRRMAQFVQDTRQVDRRTNTSKAFDPKVLEHQQFCDYVCPNDPHRCNLNGEKVRGFMFYTGMREQKPRGGGKGILGSKYSGQFNTKECDALTENFKDQSNSMNVALPKPKKPIGQQTFAQCQAVLKRMHPQQSMLGVNSTPWEFIWDLNCKELFKHVKERAPALRKANYVEKHMGEFAPHIMVERYGEIEDAFWGDAAVAPSS